MLEKRIVNLRTASFAAPYVRETLLRGNCSGILPFSLLQGENFCFGVYHTDGYLRLRRVKKLDAEQILLLAEKILRLIDRCSDCLLYPEDYILNPDTLYVRRDLSEIRLAYLPASGKTDVRRSLRYLLAELKPLTGGNGLQSLKLLEQLLESEDQKTDRLIGCLEERRREIAFLT